MTHPPMGARAIDRVVVVIPAHNEEELLPSCLAAVRVAAGGVAVPVHLVVVLDACTDASADALGGDVVPVVVDDRNVGAARAAGFAALRATARTWYATTDADTVVTPTWLSDQLQRARAGADVVLGTVRVRDWHRHLAELRTRYTAAYTDADGHRHVHGANLGIGAPGYELLGGFAPLPAHEDVDLVERAVAAGLVVDWTADVVVHTSARTDGRAPAGFAAHLRELSGAL